jgi:hypothetical protein
MSPLLMQACSRPIQPYQGGNSIIGVERLLFNRFATARLLRKNSVSGVVPAAMKKSYLTSLTRTCWGHDWQDMMDWGPIGSNRPDYTVACANCEYDNRDKEDVNFLLNMALELKGNAPRETIQLVTMAERIGVSRYGRFVGGQSYIQAKAQLGEFDAAFKRWEELRDGEAGYPPYLDKMLLHGMAKANDYSNLAKVLPAIAEREDRDESSALHYAVRRAYMANGEHKRISTVPVPKWAPKTRDAHNLGNYSEAFFEARRLLETGKLVDLYARATQVWDRDSELEIGVIVDSMMMRALTGQLLPESAEAFSPDDKGMLHAIPDADFHWFLPGRTLDYMVLEVLSGRRKAADLPQINQATTWHGLRYSERPQAYESSGLLTEGEALARDRYIRGVLAFLTQDMPTARTELEACIQADQRYSYEYHVAEWLLVKQIPKD